MITKLLKPTSLGVRPLVADVIAFERALLTERTRLLTPFMPCHEAVEILLAKLLVPTLE